MFKYLWYKLLQVLPERFLSERNVAADQFSTDKVVVQGSRGHIRG